MKKDKIITLLNILQADSINPLEEWVRCSCIFAHHKHASGKDNNPSSGISIHAGVSVYHCYSCGTKLPIDDALTELMILNKIEGIDNSNIAKALSFLDDASSELYFHEEDIEEEKKFKNVFDFGDGWLEGFSSVFNFPKALAYLENRDGGKVPDQVIKDFDLKYDQPHSMIGFPFRDKKHNRIAGMRGRSIDPIINSDDTRKSERHFDYKYKGNNNSNIVWYRESMLNSKKPLIVVEGEFDCARVYQAYRNVTAILTANASSTKMDGICQFISGIYWLTDNDDAGVKSRKKARLFFKSRDVPFTDIYCPDGYKDPGATPIDILSDAIFEHLELDEIIN